MYSSAHHHLPANQQHFNTCYCTSEFWANNNARVFLYINILTTPCTDSCHSLISLENKDGSLMNNPSNKRVYSSAGCIPVNIRHNFRSFYYMGTCGCCKCVNRNAIFVTPNVGFFVVILFSFINKITLSDGRKR